MNKRMVAGLVMLGTWLLMTFPLLAQLPDRQETKEIRKETRAERKKFVAANLVLTEDEAVKFWPLYEKYVDDGAKIWDVRIGIIRDFAANYQTLTNEHADNLLARSFECEQAMLQLRREYQVIFGKALAGRKIAMFFQIDKEFALRFELELVGKIPLVKP